VLIGRVIGEVVATQKHASHLGRKALIVQPLQLDGSNRGDAVVALDAVDAGVGDRVLLVTEGYSAMTSVGRPESPIDMAVVGVIDLIDCGNDGAGTAAGTAPAPPPELPVGAGEKLGLPSVAVEKKPGRKGKS
jgi:Carbon dioxide concentrating mechanism/carboxysome shell protein